MYKPDIYLSVNDLQRRDADDFTDEFQEEIAKMSGRCLDIGSGPGDVVIDFILPKLDAQSTIVCSDISKSMMDFGREKHRKNNRLSFMNLNIETPDLPEDLVEQFDHVTSFYCIHWCQNLRKVFENIFSLLRPGGTVFLTFPANYPGLNAYTSLATMERYQPYMQDAARFIPVFQHVKRPLNTLKTLLKDVGFEIQHCSRREMSYVFDTPNILSEFMVAVNPFIERIPADLTEDYTKDLLREAMKHKIVFNDVNGNSEEYSIMSRYFTFVVYLRKPLAV